MQTTDEVGLLALDQCQAPRIDRGKVGVALGQRAQALEVGATEGDHTGPCVVGADRGVEQADPPREAVDVVGDDSHVGGDQVGERDVVGRDQRASIAMTVRLGYRQRECPEHPVLVGEPSGERPAAHVVDGAVGIGPSSSRVAAVFERRGQPFDPLAERRPQGVPRPPHRLERIHPQLGDRCRHADVLPVRPSRQRVCAYPRGVDTLTIGGYRFSETDALRTLLHAFDLLDLYPPQAVALQGPRRARILEAMSDGDRSTDDALESVMSRVWPELLGARDELVASGLAAEPRRRRRGARERLGRRRAEAGGRQRRGRTRRA